MLGKKNTMFLIGLLFLFACFVACGDDSGNNSTDKELQEEIESSSDESISSSSISQKKNKSSSSEVEKNTKASSGKESEKNVSSSSKTGDKKASSDSMSSGIDELSSSSSSEKNSAQSSSSKKNKGQIQKSSVTDWRDNHTYKTVKIGNQEWFAENLNYDDRKSICPMHDAANCDAYGRLYTFDGAEKKSDIWSVCPEGWHVPDSLEWMELFDYVSKHNEGEGIAVSLKAEDGWYAEGASVLVEGDGYHGFVESLDSLRIGAQKGTDRFGFAALPAGVCWDNGCHVGDDARFVVKYILMEDRGCYGNGGFKFAFDKNDVFYDEDVTYSYSSVRCVKDPVIKIDSMPRLAVFDSKVWMVEDLSHNGSTEFSIEEAVVACPEGWRLPKSDEYDSVARKCLFDSFFENSGDFFFYGFEDQPIGVKMHIEKMSTEKCSQWSYVTPYYSAPKHVRCISEWSYKTVSGCSCTASKYNPKDSSISWKVSGCNENNSKIEKYAWKFGENSADVKISGSKAIKKFKHNELVAPAVHVISNLSVPGATFEDSLLLDCSAGVGTPADTILFSDNDVSVFVPTGKNFVAKKNVKCAYATYVTVSCNPIDIQDQDIFIKIADKLYEGEWGKITAKVEELCEEDVFSIEASANMECSLHLF